MLTHQLAMPFPAHRRFAPILRCRRRLFTPRTPQGPYKLPKGVHERLTAALQPFRNGEAALALATFLGRFWSCPGRLETPFPIDRRALAGHRDLELAEGQVRGAMLTLERIGFLDRAPVPKGSVYKPTPDGLRRKPILFRFGVEYAPAFTQANRRSAAKRLATSSPKNKTSWPKVVLMDEIAGLPKERIVPSEPDPGLEAALARLRVAMQLKRTLGAKGG